MVTITQEPPTQVLQRVAFKPNLMGLDERVQSKLTGCSLKMTKYKQGIQFELQAGNDFLFKASATSLPDHVSVKVGVVYRGEEEITIRETKVPLVNPEQFNHDIEYVILEAFSIVVNLKDMEYEFDLDFRKAILTGFTNNIKARLDAEQAYNEALEELYKRAKQIKLA